MNLSQAQLPRSLSESALSLFKQMRGLEFIYLVDEATVPDLLAHAGTIAAMRRASSRYQIARNLSEVKAHVKAADAGSAILCTSVADAVELQEVGAEAVVVLPQSMFEVSAAVAALPEKVLVLCRDFKTLQVMRTSLKSARCALAHHMAFNLSVHKVLNDDDTGVVARGALPAALDRYGTSLDKIAGHPRISVFRDQRRRCLGAVGVPLDGAIAGLRHDLGVRPAVWSFVRILSRARGVATDSIETAIGCALLGVDCELIGDPDGESAWVFETSLSLFDNMRFVPSG